MNKLAEHLFRSALSVSPRRLRVPPPRSHQLLGACGSAPPREPPGSRQVRLQQVSHRLHTFTQPSEAQASFPFRYWGCAHTAAPLLALSPHGAAGPAPPDAAAQELHLPALPAPCWSSPSCFHFQLPTTAAPPPLLG